MSARWAFLLVAPGTGEQLGELTIARGRSLSYDLRGPASVRWSMDAREEMARHYRELRTDLVAYRDGRLMFRGRCGSSDDDLDEDTHTVSCSAVDYRGYLARRIDRWGREYWDNQNEIAWDMIDQVAQYGDGGSLPITEGSRAADIWRWEVVDVDTKITDVVDRFQDYDDGFEWEISPELVLNRWTWRGQPRPDFPLVWGVTGAKLKRSYDTGIYADWVRMRGGKMDKPPDYNDDDPNDPGNARSLPSWASLPAQGAVPWDAYWVGSSRTDRVLAVWAADQWQVALGAFGAPVWSWQVWEDMPTPFADRWAPNLASLLEGRIDKVVTNSELKSQQAVDDAAAALLADSLQVPAAYSATLEADLWPGPNEAWLGDLLPVVVRSGRLEVATTGRIYGVDITISDDDGSEEVTMTFGEVQSE